MQLDDAKTKREQWGDKPCEHPDFDKEYDRGIQTGDYVCEQCGAYLDAGEVEEIRERKKRPTNS